MEKLRREFEIIAEDRFSPQAGTAFKRLKQITGYHELDKRDGGFLQRATTDDGEIIAGDKLCKRVIEHYASVHNQVPDNPAEPFPDLQVRP
jgi:hypothetical protein